MKIFLCSFRSLDLINQLNSIINVSYPYSTLAASIDSCHQNSPIEIDDIIVLCIKNQNTSNFLGLLSVKFFFDSCNDLQSWLKSKSPNLPRQNSSESSYILCDTIFFNKIHPPIISNIVIEEVPENDISLVESKSLNTERLQKLLLLAGQPPLQGLLDSIKM